MKVQKRDGRIVPYDAEKIRIAIQKANAVVEAGERASAGRIEGIIRHVACK